MASAEAERTSGSLSRLISCREVTSALCANQVRTGTRGVYDCRGSGRGRGGEGEGKGLLGWEGLLRDVPAAGPSVVLLLDNKQSMWSPQCHDEKRIKVQQYKPRLSA